jgi:ABC-type transport system involved in cytochrome c biogenesis permease subunit
MTDSFAPAGAVLPGSVRPRAWVAAAVFALLLSGVLEYVAGRATAAGALAGLDLAGQMIGYANLLLLASTCLYVAHLRYGAAAIGRWASALAALGALGLLDGLMLEGAASYLLHGSGPLVLMRLPDVMPLFSACTVLIYLAMEHVYRTRAAGAFLMPVVAAAVLSGAWLSAGGEGAPTDLAPVLRSYAVRAHILAHVVSYGAFAVAAAAAVMDLLRRRARAPRALPGLARIRRLTHRSVALGLALLSLATVAGIASANRAWGRYWAWEPKECATLALWLVYAGYLYLHHARRWRGARMAWLALLGFGVGAFGFFGVKLLASGLHAYA